MILAVTGHRPNKVGGYNTPNRTFNEICTGMDSLLVQLRPSRVLIGMALGVDQWMAQLCIFNGIPFTAAIPFPADPITGNGFESKWPTHSQMHYRTLLRSADRIEYICDPPYEGWKMQRRNEWMVDHCDALIAVFDGTEGGTKNCVDYAISVGKPIHYVRFQSPNRVVNREIPREVVVRPAAEALRNVSVDVRVIPSQEREPSPGDIAVRARIREALRQEEEEERQQRARIAQAARDTLLNDLLESGVPVREVQTLAQAVGRRRRRRPVAEDMPPLNLPPVSSEEEPKKETEPVVHEFGRVIEFE